MGFDLGSAFKSAITGAGAGAMVGGPWGALAGAVGGGLLGGFMGGGDPYQKLGSPMDVQNVNPYTQEMLDKMRRDRAFYENYLKSAMQDRAAYQGEVDRLRKGLENYTFTTNYDPTAAQRQFLAMAPELQRLARKSIGTTAAEEQAKLLASQAVKQAAAQFAGGGLNSGAALKAFGQGAALPLAQYQSNRESLENQLLQNLYGQSFGGLQQGYQYQAGLDWARQQAAYGALMDAVRAAQAQAAMGLSREQMGMQGSQASLGLMGQYGAPQWWQPSYVPNPNYMSNTDLLGMGLQVGGMIGNSRIPGQLSNLFAPSPKTAGSQNLPYSDLVMMSIY